jgi:hypothetical protein
LRRFTEIQRNLPTADGTAAVVGHRNIQLITAAPDIGTGNRTGNATAATARTAARRR